MEFDAEKETKNIVRFVKEYFKKNKVSGCILGISGGKDSAIACALMVEAIGCDNVIGVSLPCHSLKSDKVDAEKISKYYGIKLYNLDLTKVYDRFKTEISKISGYNPKKTKNSDINLKPRLRMSSLYYFASLFGEIYDKRYIVVGTSNKCELYVGYFTKGGDSICDISLLSDLTVSEVLSIGEYLGVPKEILYKPPHDGLSNMTDEEKLGVTYMEITSFIEGNLNKKTEVYQKIKRLHENAKHKFNTPTYKKETGK